MYLPKLNEVKNVPELNSFYRAEQPIMVSQIANQARKKAGLDRSYIWKTIRAIAASPWNKSHIKYSTRGYENYNIQGPQYRRNYGLEPMSQPNTGNNYPVLWIPDPDSPLEPGEIFVDVVQSKVDVESQKPVKPISPEVVEDVVRKKPKVVIRPQDQETADVINSVPDTLTEQEVAMVERAADTMDKGKKALVDPTLSQQERDEAANELISAVEQMEVAPKEQVRQVKAKIKETTQQKKTKKISGDGDILTAIKPIALSLLFAKGVSRG